MIRKEHVSRTDSRAALARVLQSSEDWRVALSTATGKLHEIACDVDASGFDRGAFDEAHSKPAPDPHFSAEELSWLLRLGAVERSEP